MDPVKTDTAMASLAAANDDGGAAAAKGEEDITKDDLQAMKDMIGDIKKDPSLLYRLSSLPGGSNAQPNGDGGRNGTNHNASASKIFVDDDATDVSSLGMMSSGDYAYGNGASRDRGRAKTPGSRLSPLALGPSMNPREGQSSASFARATAHAVQTATAVRRTNHDAEIALRMQSLRAKRGFSQPRPSPMKNSGSSPNIAGIGVGVGATAAAPAIKVSPTPPPPPPHQRLDSPGENEDDLKNDGGRGRGTFERDDQTPADNSDPRNGKVVAAGDKIKDPLQARSGSRRRGQEKNPITKSMKTADSSKSSENSMSLVLYDEEKAGDDEEHDRGQGGLMVSSQRGGEGYNNYALDPPFAGQAPSAAQHYHFAVSKYVVDKPIGRKNNNIANRGVQKPQQQQQQKQQQKQQQQQQQQQHGEGNQRRSQQQPHRDGSRRRNLSKASSTRRLPREKEGSRRKIDRKVSDDPPGAGKYTPATHLAASSKNPQRSRSVHTPRRPRGKGKERSRGASAQPPDRGGTTRGGSRHARHRQHKKHSEVAGDGVSSAHRQGRRSAKNQVDPPPSLSQGRSQPRPPQQHQQHRHHHSIDMSSSSIPLDKNSLIESLRAEQQQTSVMMLDRTKQSSDEKQLRQDEDKHVQANEQLGEEMLGGLERAKANEGRFDRLESYGERGDMVGSLPVSTAMENAMYLNGHHRLSKDSISSESAMDRKLEFGSDKRRPSMESESGRSVTSRLSKLRRRGLRKKDSKRSLSSYDAGRGGTFHASDNDSSPRNPSGSEGSAGNEPRDEHAPPKEHLHHSFHKGLRSRISNLSGASPIIGSRKRLSTADDGTAAALADVYERLSKAERTPVTAEQMAYLVANDDSDHVTLGIELAVRAGQVPRMCDERGRCLFHPHIRLQKPKLFGGWKVLFQHCPDCAVEHMKKTQEKLIEVQQRQKEQKEREEREAARLEAEEKEKKKKEREHKKKKNKRSKDRNKQDPIIGKNVGDEYFVESKSMKKKRNRKKEKEKLRQELAVSSARMTDTMDKPLATPQDMDDGNNQQLIEPTEDKASNSEQDAPQKQQEHQPQADEQLATEPPPPDPSHDKSHALVPHKKPERKRVNGLPWSDYNGQSGRYTGEVNEQYLPHGRGEMLYDRGVVCSGVWYDGVLDTEDDGGGCRGGGVGRGGGGRLPPPTMLQEPPEILPQYALGDRGKDSDMIIASKKETAASVAKIRVGDAAFVRRSDGSWTYAVVKDRTGGDEMDKKGTIRFMVNLRGSTKAFPTSQWGTYVRRIHIERQADPTPAPPRGGGAAEPSGRTLGDFLDMKNTGSRMSGAISVAGALMRDSDGDSISVNSARSAPMMKNSMQNLTTGKMKMRARSRSKSRNRKNVTTLPLLFSSSMSVSEENNEGLTNDDWETASGSGYRLRGIDP